MLNKCYSGLMSTTAFGLVLGLMTASVSAAEPPASGQTFKLFDFSEPDRQGSWRVVNDNVMGGRSQGTVDFTGEGSLLFRGEVSLENRGGFSSIRTRAADLGLDGAQALTLRVRGDGRTYHVDLRVRRQPAATSFRAPITPVAGQWQDITVPFDEFRASAFGRDLRGIGPVDPAMIRSIGFTINDGKSGPFALEVAGLGAVRETEQVSSEVDKPDIAAVASAAGSFTTLLAAAEAAGLGDVLRADGAITVFAPTDEAFGELPDGLVDRLLDPDNKDMLQAILTYHVLPEEVPLGDRALETIQGESLTLAAEAHTINGVRVTEANIRARNGVIHVIDQVLIPPGLDLSPPPDPVREILTLAIERGAPLFNRRQTEACAAIYEVATEAVLRLPDESVGAETRALLAEALQSARELSDPSRRAWALRRAFDDVLEPD